MLLAVGAAGVAQDRVSVSGVDDWSDIWLPGGGACDREKKCWLPENPEDQSCSKD